MKQKLLEYMSGRRMCSVSNLMERLNITFEDIMPVLKGLEIEGLIRVARGKGCGSSCSDCSSCGVSDDKTCDPASTIVISTQKKEEKDDS